MSIRRQFEDEFLGRLEGVYGIGEEDVTPTGSKRCLVVFVHDIKTRVMDSFMGVSVVKVQMGFENAHGPLVAIATA
jgi:hypothetical protein